MRGGCEGWRASPSLIRGQGGEKSYSRTSGARFCGILTRNLSWKWEEELDLGTNVLQSVVERRGLSRIKWVRCLEVHHNMQCEERRWAVLPPFFLSGSMNRKLLLKCPQGPRAQIP